jgi:hypothetical protein
MMILLFLFFLQTTPLDLKFNEQETWEPNIIHGKEVTIRGYIYQTSDGTHILSDEPGLKSCCIGRGKKSHNQIRLVGDIPIIPQGNVALVKGTFLINDLGTPERLKYQLINTTLVQENKLFTAMAWGIIVIAVFFSCIWLWRVLYEVRSNDKT